MSKDKARDLPANRSFLFGRNPLQRVDLPAPSRKLLLEPRKDVVIPLWQSPKIDLHIPGVFKEKAEKYNTLLRPLRQEERFDFFERSNVEDQLGVGTTFETDVFILAGADDTFDFKGGKLCIFLNRIVRSKMMEYHVLVQTNRRKNEWKRSKFKMQDSMVLLDCGNYVGFVVINQPRRVMLELSQKGDTFRSSVDKRIKAEFLPDSVQSQRNLTLKVIPASLKNNSKFLPVLSPTLYMKDQEECRFFKPVNVQLPVANFEEGDKEHQQVVLKWTNEGVEVIQDDLDIKNGLATFEVDSFSGVSAARMSKTERTSQALTIEAELARGGLIPCRILTFYWPDSWSRDKAIRWECVEDTMVDDVVERNKELGLTEIPRSRSNDFFLRDGHRISVKAMGCMGLTKHQAKCANLTYIRVSSNNYHVIYLTNTTSMTREPAVVMRYESLIRDRLRFEWTVRFLPDSLTTRPFKKAPQHVQDKARQRKDIASSIPCNISTKKIEKSHKTTPRTVTDVTIPVESHAVDTKELEEQDASDCPIRIVQNHADIPNDTPFFSEKSMSSLARQISIDDSLQFGVHLGLAEEFISILCQECSPADRVFKMLSYWMKQTPGDKNAKYRVLVEALAEMGLDPFVPAIQTAFEENRGLRRKDFEL